MSAPETQSGRETLREEVLTLAEAASFLRVHEQAVVELAADQAIPAQKIGGEWRFLKKALEEWLRCGPRYFRDRKALPYPFLFEAPLVEDLLFFLERRVLDKLGGAAPPHGKRGSKQAVLEHVGVFREDEDLEERLADAKARREAAGGT
jgi:excisionase family DNA binding protein